MDRDQNFPVILNTCQTRNSKGRLRYHGLGPCTRYVNEIELRVLFRILCLSSFAIYVCVTNFTRTDQNNDDDCEY